MGQNFKCAKIIHLKIHKKEDTTKLMSVIIIIMVIIIIIIILSLTLLYSIFLLLQKKRNIMTNFCTANQQQQFYRYFQQHDNNNNNNNDSDNKHDIAGYVPTNVNYNSRIVEQQRRVDSLKEKLLLFDGIGKISEVAAESPLHRSKKESDASDDSIDVDAVFDDDTDDTDGGLLRQQPQLMMPNSSSRQLRMIFSSENVALIQISKTVKTWSINTTYFLLCIF